MSTAREPCPNCQLPFYTDRNEHCPYCGTAPGTAETDSAGPEVDDAGSTPGTASVDTTPAGSVRRETPPSRPRTTCSQCGLDHYADDDGGCPYCSAATESSGESAEEAATETEPEPAGPTASSGGSDDRTARQSGDSGGLLSRILGMFGR